MNNVQYNIPVKNVINIDDFKNKYKFFVCFYKISKKYDSLPFLHYLLYKYPKGKNETLIFPFDIYHTSKKPINIANKLAYSLVNKQDIKFNGIISNSYGHFFFYQYLFLLLVHFL